MAKKKTEKKTPPKKAPRVRFATGATKPGGEFVETPPEPRASDILTEVQKFYIAGHPQKSDSQLAMDLGVTAKLVENYRFEVTHQSPANRMLHRPAKGVVAMTEGASIVTDDRTRNQVSNVEIRQAIANGDLEKAAELQKKLKEQTAERDKQQREQYSDRIHRVYG